MLSDDLNAPLDEELGQTERAESSQLSESNTTNQQELLKVQTFTNLMQRAIDEPQSYDTKAFKPLATGIQVINECRNPERSDRIIEEEDFVALNLNGRKIVRASRKEEKEKLTVEAQRREVDEHLYAEISGLD